MSEELNWEMGVITAVRFPISEGKMHGVLDIKHVSGISPREMMLTNIADLATKNGLDDARSLAGRMVRFTRRESGNVDLLELLK
jgi:hypothetical protein